MFATQDSCTSFEVFAGQPAHRTGPWKAALARAFELGRRLRAQTAVEQRAGRLTSPAFLRGKLSQGAVQVQEDLSLDYPLELRSPFEGVDSVAGAVWLGSDLFGETCDDAIMKLRFESGSIELPLHAHEYSDRIIVVLRGSGCFHFSTQTLREFDGQGVQSLPVGPQMVLLFTRGLLHTFSAPTEPLCLLSYHGPFIPLDDPRQFALPQHCWMPKC